MTVDEIHECEFQGPGIRIERSGGWFHTEPTWQLVVTREATEADLEDNHHLEWIGDSIWSTVIEINHCPYCGRELRDEKAENIRFTLFDSTGYNVKLL